MTVNELLTFEIKPEMTISFLQNLEQKYFKKINDLRTSFATKAKLYKKVSEVHHETFNKNREY